MAMLVACAPPQPNPAAEDSESEPAQTAMAEPSPPVAIHAAPDTGSAPSVAPSPDGDLSGIAARLLGRRAFGYYLRGQKIGYELRDVAMVETEQGPFLRRTREFRTRTRKRGLDAESTSISHEWYWLKDGGALARFESERTSDGEKSTVRAAWRDGRFEVTRTIAGEVETRVIESPRASFGELKRAAEFPSPETEVGAVLEFWVLDQGSTSFSRCIQYRLLSRSAHAGNPSEQPFYEIESVSRGVVSRFVRDGDGTDRGNNDGPFEVRTESEEIAVQFPVAPPDLIEFSIVRIATDMGSEASALRETSLLIGGVAGFAFPSAPGQSVERLSDDLVRVRIQRKPTAAAAEPLDEASRARFVAGEVGIESESETIRTRAKRIVGGARDFATQVAKLQRWVHGHLADSRDLQSTSALVILRRGGGDCSEHARLFVALARAIGLPAREVSGLLYCNDDGPAFAWHAWAEVHDGTRWVGVDPAWNQVGLDAGHVIIARDAEDDSWNRLIGRIRIEVERFGKSGR